MNRIKTPVAETGHRGEKHFSPEIVSGAKYSTRRSGIESGLSILLNLSYCGTGVTNTLVEPWSLSFDDFTEALRTPKIGLKDGSYFMTNSMHHNRRSKDNARWGGDLFMLDGDSTIYATGEVRDGAPPPEHVSEALSAMGLNHLIYSSFSNQLDGKGNRYRVAVPANIGNEEEYLACVEWTIDQLHRQQVMLANVSENSTISQPWYFPRCTEENKRYFQFYENSEGECDFPVNEAVEWYRERAKNLAQSMPEEHANPTRELDPSKPIDKFCMERGTEYVCDLLQEHGYTYRHSSQMNGHPSYHFVAPESSTGGAGVNVYIGRGNGKVLACSHHGEHDPLRREPKAALDSFQVYTDLEHGGDQKAALKAITQPESVPEAVPDTVVDFSSFSLRGESQIMKKQMLDDVFVLGEIAILGQWTTLYAGPNTGKTLLALHLLIESISNGNLEGSDVFYINADDTYRGLVEKLELAEKHGFEMLAPSQKGFKAGMLISIMEKMVEAGAVKGKVVVLDTLKKFTDLMDKKRSSEFGDTAREFVSAGGTIISLAHTNKNKDTDGKSVHAGTSDIKDDSDCCFIMDTISVDGDTKTVQFENIKSRGDVAQLATYKYCREEGETYFDLLDSIEKVSKEEAAEERAVYKKREFFEEKREAVNEIVACINGGITLKTELIKEVHERTTESRGTVKKLLTMGRGTGKSELQFWTTKTGERNSQIFRLNDKTRKYGALF